MSKPSCWKLQVNNCLFIDSRLLFRLVLQPSTRSSVSFGGHPLGLKDGLSCLSEAFKPSEE